ncbi:MAG TPA: hypothetical protein VMR51_02135 [Patescibacteria group bacterium]|nr:hypothetical protein [Patescibacteria group bacterium]
MAEQAPIITEASTSLEKHLFEVLQGINGQEFKIVVESTIIKLVSQFDKHDHNETHIQNILTVLNNSLAEVTIEPLPDKRLDLSQWRIDAQTQAAELKNIRALEGEETFVGDLLVLVKGQYGGIYVCDKCAEKIPTTLINRVRLSRTDDIYGFQIVDYIKADGGIKLPATSAEAE